MTTTPQPAPALGKQCMDSCAPDGFIALNMRCFVPAKYREPDYAGIERDFCHYHAPSRMAARRQAKQRAISEGAALAGIANPAAVPELVRAARAVNELIGAKRDLILRAGLDSPQPSDMALGALQAALTALDKKGE